MSLDRSEWRVLLGKCKDRNSVPFLEKGWSSFRLLFSHVISHWSLFLGQAIVWISVQHFLLASVYGQHVCQKSFDHHLAGGGVGVNFLFERK